MQSVTPAEEREEAGPVPVVHLSLSDAGTSGTSQEVGTSASAFELSKSPRPLVIDVYTAAPLMLTVLLAVHARVMVTLQSSGDTAPVDALLELAGVLCSVVVRLAAASQSLVYKAKHMILFTRECNAQLRILISMVWTHRHTHTHTHTHTITHTHTHTHTHTVGSLGKSGSGAIGHTPTPSHSHGATLAELARGGDCKSRKRPALGVEPGASQGWNA
jgi:hypothetical protein